MNETSEEKIYISLKEATKYCNYSQDYLKLRARQGKLKAAKLGRNWVTTKEWLEAYLNKVEEYGSQLNNRISLQEATQFCNYSQEYLSLRARQGKLKAVKLDRNWATTKEWLRAYLNKAEEYGSQLNNKKAKEVAPPENLPIGELIKPKISWWKSKGPELTLENLRTGFIVVLVLVLIIAGGIFGLSPIMKTVGNQQIALGIAPVTVKEITRGTFSIFKEYGQWVSGTAPLRSYFAANEFVEEKLSNIFRIFASPFKAIWRFVTRPPAVSLTKEELMEIEKKETEKIIREIQKLKEEGVPIREIIKEVKKITEILPVKEITKETIKIDEKALKQLKEDIAYLQEEMQKRLYAPGGVISQTIYVTEPIMSPKIYQENGEIVLQTLGSGNVIISAATGLQLYGKQVVIESTSLLNPLIYLASNTRIGGDLTVTGSISGGALSVSSLAVSGNATVGGNLTVSGDLTVSGSSNITVTPDFSTPVSITASSTSPALQVRQNGSGLIAQFLDGSGTSIFSIANDGSITANATITAASFASADTDSTVRKSGEEVFREIVPISRYDIPAQTSTTTYFRISKYFDQNPLSSVPVPLPGATRVYKLIIKYSDNIPTNSSSSWRIYQPPPTDITTSTFVLLGRGVSSSLVEGIATTTENLTIPDTDWQVDVKLPSENYTLRIFQIFLAAFDKIN